MNTQKISKGKKNLRRCIYCCQTKEELDGLPYIYWRRRHGMLCALCWEKIGEFMDWFSELGYRR
jgi:hypothetical protein